MTRRRFLYGALGAGVVAAAGIGAVAYRSSGATSDEIAYLSVAQDAIATQNDFEALDNADSKLWLAESHDIPYGTLIWANDDTVAACLLPTETGSPLAKAGLLFLGSGEVATLAEKAQGASEGFEIYDVRANRLGIVWTEANILQGSWRVYTAPLVDGSLGQARLVEEGGDALETPTLAVAQDKAFWQVLPKASADRSIPSRLMCVPFDGGEVRLALESARRMGTPVYGGADHVVVTPRLDAPTAYHQLTCVGTDGEIRDTLTLPAGMRPLEAGYGDHGFTFSFSAIYSYGEGISNLGTYTPMAKPSDGDYSSVPWFDFARTPTAAPAWCNGLLVVKSTYSVCGIDLADRTYFALDVENGADTYGEYLASSGAHDTLVTYTNIDHTPVGEDHIHTCRVKIWRSLA